MLHIYVYAKKSKLWLSFLYLHANINTRHAVVVYVFMDVKSNDSQAILIKIDFLEPFSLTTIIFIDVVLWERLLDDIDLSDQWFTRFKNNV